MDIWPTPHNDSLIGNWEGSPVALTALTLGAEHIVLAGEKYMEELRILPAEDLTAAVAAGVQAAALEAALVGNVLAMLADAEAWANPTNF
ncbi:MAG: hypothetical protein SNJ60_02355 [Pseudanabaenaceae cyanobacterium]